MNVLKRSIHIILTLACAILMKEAAAAADSGIFRPNAYANSPSGWSNPQYAFQPDDLRAIANSGSDIIQLRQFGITILPSGAEITGIEVHVEGYVSNLSNQVRQADVSLSWNNGASYTAGNAVGVKRTALPKSGPGLDGIAVLGGPADTWGRSWLPADFDNLRFRVRLDATSNKGNLYVDSVSVKIYYMIPTVTPAIEILPATLLTASVGAAYRQQIFASTTANGPFVWSVASGSLPVGLILEADPAGVTATITGVLLQAVNSEFILSVSNGLSSSTRSYAISVVGDGSTTSENLILNPSLENGTANQPTNWHTNKWGNNTADFAYPVEGAGGVGTKAARVQITSYPSADINVGGDAKWYFDDVSVSAGQSYVFRDMFKSNIPSDIVARFSPAGGGPATYQYLGTVGPASNWQSYEASFAVPGGATAMTVFHLIHAAGVLIVDEYSLAPLAAADRFDQGFVSLAFDDGWESAYQSAVPILDAYGYKSTQYVITDKLLDGVEGDGYVSQAQLKAMASSGHDIAAHSRSHPDLTRLDQDRLKSEVSGSRQDLLVEPISMAPVSSFAYTYGLYDERVVQEVKTAGFSGARTVETGFNTMSSDPFLLKAMPIQRGGKDGELTVTATALSDVQTAIDSAVAGKAWLILLFHQVDNDAASVYGTSPRMIQDIAAHLSFSNVLVRTVSEGLALMKK